MSPSKRLKTAWRKINTRILPDVKKALQDGRLVFVIGMPGTGKTTLAEKALPEAYFLEARKHYAGEFGFVIDEFPYHEQDPTNTILLARATGTPVLVLAQSYRCVRSVLRNFPPDQYKIFNLDSLYKTRPSTLFRLRIKLSSRLYRLSRAVAPG